MTITQGYGSWNHVKEIANTRLLCASVHHCYNGSANLQVFDVSRKAKARKIYSFEQIPGSRVIVKIHLIIILVTGHGDVTYNPRRSILGAISVGRNIT